MCDRLWTFLKISTRASYGDDKWAAGGLNNLLNNHALLIATFPGVVSKPTGQISSQEVLKICTIVELEGRDFHNMQAKNRLNIWK